MKFLIRFSRIVKSFRLGWEKHISEIAGASSQRTEMAAAVKRRMAESGPLWVRAGASPTAGRRVATEVSQDNNSNSNHTNNSNRSRSSGIPFRTGRPLTLSPRGPPGLSPVCLATLQQALNWQLWVAKISPSVLSKNACRPSGS